MKRLKWSALCAAALAFGAAGGLWADDQDPAAVFKSLDKNGDGKLQADEVPEAQRRFFERLLRVGDKDSDGVLTSEEYAGATADAPAPRGPDGPSGGGPGFGGPFGGDRRPEPGVMFDRLDTNKDGKLTREELPEMFRDRLGRVFDAVGKDSITREELTRAMQRYGGGEGRPPMPPGAPGRPDAPMPPGPGGFGGPPGGFGEGMRGRGPAFLRALDANGDMQLSSAEVESAAAKLKTLDHNDDGVIDISELMGGPPPGEGGPFGGPGFGGPPGAVPGGVPMPPRRDGDANRPPGPRDGDRPEADRRGGERREGERPEERRDANRREGRPSEANDNPRPEGPPREGDRPGFGGPGFGREGGPGGPGGPFGGLALIRELDTDRNQRLSQDELAAAMSRLDRNKDGELDQSEIIGFAGFGGPGMREGGRPGAEGGSQEMFNRMDRNGDGAVSRDEVPERLRTRFDDADKNDDDKLDAEEAREVLRGLFGGQGDGARPPGRGRGDGDGNRPQRPETEDSAEKP